MSIDENEGTPAEEAETSPEVTAQADGGDAGGSEESSQEAAD